MVTKCLHRLSKSCVCVVKGIQEAKHTVVAIKLEVMEIMGLPTQCKGHVVATVAVHGGHERHSEPDPPKHKW